MESQVKLFSDFVDYYDMAFNPNGVVAYTRNICDCKIKSDALAWLKLHSIPSIDIRPVTSFNPLLDKKLVVYIDPSLHGGKGKILMSCREAIENYPNYLASKFIDGTDGNSLKFLQVGGRKFHVTMRNSNNEYTLDPGEVLKITELRPGFTYSVPIPIFSIDYISRGGSMVAVDFNEIQNLESLGIDKIMSPEEVVFEVEKSLNKFGNVLPR